MNVLFILSAKDSLEPDQPLETQMHVQLGVSSIAALLKARGHATELLVLCRKTGRARIDETITRFDPRLICFSAVFSEYDFIARIARYIKSRYPRIYLLAGGPHVSLNPEEAARDAFDAVCLGEGEFPALELVDQLERGPEPVGIPNLWITDGEHIQRNAAREFNEDLDGLPFPDREMWQKWISYPLTAHTVLLGRGCPFRCTYCCNHALRGIAPGRYVRFRSPRNIVREVEEVSARYPQPPTIYLENETIGVNTEFAQELCSRLERLNRDRTRPLSFGMNLRITPGADYNPLFRAMQKAKFSSVNIGLESGSERVRRRTLGRNYSNSDYLQAVGLAREYGLKINVFVMIGIPGETLADFRQTIDCVRRSQPDEPFYSIFFPYPGTVLYKRCKEQGLLPERLDVRGERGRAILDLPGFSRRQIQSEYDWFYYNVYKGYRPWGVIWRKTKRRKIRSSYLLSTVYSKLALPW